ncbi:MAG: hypothetical protein Q9167_001311 [Letrouitia subvulpina]
MTASPNIVREKPQVASRNARFEITRLHLKGLRGKAKSRSKIRQRASMFITIKSRPKIFFVIGMLTDYRCFHSSLTSPIVTICVGPEQRLFAAHESVLARSPFFAAITHGQFLESTSKRVVLPEESPEVFSSVLEYLYKGDYYPRLLHNKRKNAWELEDSEGDNGISATVEATVDHALYQQTLLKDTVLYCTAERYDLPELKRLALRKQGLRSGIHCATILASARYAYANTPDSDSKLRAHYLALIIRSKATFKRSGTMQMEMEKGGRLFFDLFVAVCNHMVSFEPLCFTCLWQTLKKGEEGGGECNFSA